MNVDIQIGSDLVVGLALTAVAYGFLVWAVVHGKHVVERMARGNEGERPLRGGSAARSSGGEEVGRE